MTNYRIIFSLESLFKPDGQPDAAACTIYNFMCGHAQLVGNAIAEGKLPDAMPYVQIISDQHEAKREQILERLKFNEIMLPQSLLLGNDDIGSDTILAVFDDDPVRMHVWREGGIKCYNSAEAGRIVVA